MLKYLFFLILFFVILVVIEYFIINYLIKHKIDLFETPDEKIDLFETPDEKKRLNNNIQNEEEIIKYFKNTMNKRLEMLKNMDYKEWTKYNNINAVIEYNNTKYYIFIYEKVNLNEAYILRVSYQKEFINYSYLAQRNFITDKYIILQLFPPVVELIEQMYNLSLNKDGFSEISYNWENPFTERPEKKNSIITQFHKDNFNGVIGIGYTKKDLGVNSSNIYYKFIGKFTLYLLHFIILGVVISLYLIKDGYYEFIKCSIILFFSWLILIHQITLTYGSTDMEKETNKNKEITDSILSISFLVAVNIFFIESLNFKKSNIDKNSIQKQIIFLFCISVILLLISMYKMNNYKNIDNLRSMRIRNQLYFNYSIFYSIAIFLIYIFYYFVKRK